MREITWDQTAVILFFFQTQQQCEVIANLFWILLVQMRFIFKAQWNIFYLFIIITLNYYVVLHLP
jgi:hypothetical protein